jgi:hypothetical protein
MRNILLWLLLAICIPAQADTETQRQRLEKELTRIQQESQSTYQQFLMIQELRRNEMSEAPMITAQPISPEKSIPIPKYEALVQQRQGKQERIKQYAIELDSLYSHFKALEDEKHAILEQLNALEQKPIE